MDAMALASNPLRVGMRNARTIEPCVMVIFGATGDLTHRKLLPALYNLALEHPLPPQFAIVGVARRPFTNEQFRAQALDSINSFSRRRPVRPPSGRPSRSGSFTARHNSPTSRLRTAEAARPARPRARHAGQPHLLSRDAAQLLREIADLLTATGLARRTLRPASGGSRAGRASSSRSPSGTTSPPLRRSTRS